MPRIARVRSSTGIYHVMMRGNNHQRIFDDNIDKDRFVKILEKTVKGCEGIKPSADCSIYAYALMDNHFHILVKMNSGEVGDFVKMVTSGYVLYYNRRHSRDGHLFRERFSSEICEDNDYLITLVGYIHMNPVKAGMVKYAYDYPYTSWREYLRGGGGVCDIADILKLQPLSVLQAAMQNPEIIYAPCLDLGRTSWRKLTDSDAEECLAEIHGIQHPSHLLRLPVENRDNILKDLLKRGCGIRQLQRMTGIDKSTLSRLKSNLSDSQP